MQATPFIDAEAERDPTAAGKRNAARAAAARPQPAVKDTAWQLVIEDDTLPNIVGRAVIDGFTQPGQQALLQPFTAKYFAAIPGVWERRSSEVAQTVVVGLYPSWDISQDALDAADRFLAGELPPSLHRLVLEGRAGVERALRARAFDVELGGRDAGAHHFDRADEAADQIVVIERRRSRFHAQRSGLLDATALHVGAVDHLDGLLVRRHRQQHCVVGRRHLRQDVAGVAAVSAPRSPTYTAKRAFAARDPYFNASSSRTRSLTANG